MNPHGSNRKALLEERRSQDHCAICDGPMQRYRARRYTCGDRDCRAAWNGAIGLDRYERLLAQAGKRLKQAERGLRGMRG